MKKDPIDVFDNWAINGRDEGLEEGHAPSVKGMLEWATADLKSFSFLDVGCGNGWVVRKMVDHPECHYAAGVDGSQNMIAKAKSNDPHGKYFCQDIRDWVPPTTFDLVHSMEVFYYIEQPDILIQNIYDFWLKTGGKLIMGIDFYKENKPCHSWPKDCGVNIMRLLSKNTWIDYFTKAGFKNVHSRHLGVKDEWEGTLVVMGGK